MALQDFLEDFIIDKLENWQGTEGTDGVAGLTFNALVNPSTNPYNPALSNANQRLSEVTEKLATERDDGNISSLVVPRYAALLFEGIFDACVAFWMARGTPDPATALKPDVERFVKLQVRLFLALVGAK